MVKHGLQRKPSAAAKAVGGTAAGVKQPMMGTAAGAQTSAGVVENVRKFFAEYGCNPSGVSDLGKAWRDACRRDAAAGARGGSVEIETLRADMEPFSNLVARR